MQEREGGGTPNQEEEGGVPPKKQRTPLVRGLIQDMGGGASDLQRPPTTRRSGSEGKKRKWRTGRGRGDGAPSPLGERGTTEDQA